MKLLTRLRELRIENEINSIDDYRFSMSHYHDDTLGIGTMTFDDIMRLNLESNKLEPYNLESNNLKVNHLTQK